MTRTLTDIQAHLTGKVWVKATATLAGASLIHFRGKINLDDLFAALSVEGERAGNILVSMVAEDETALWFVFSGETVRLFEIL